MPVVIYSGGHSFFYYRTTYISYGKTDTAEHRQFD